ncbi:DUF4424 domain-containing protein [Methylobacterium sp. SyP6R]|uniref:DUF4424 domain-containing protein n=1 Tax=Methylobacterium sp. SyP6R TaxID=2718876 RepID=UPI001F400761|nr:DUF4424 domain-containing protein [Methylobacterium sp. SyP6R]MCF4126580.1 DUF4424 domain-containing protein [Methylobacterium sp. SyP6R]
MTALALSLCAPARANDSAAALDAGGLVLVRDPDITLASEDLRIGLDRIAVDYVFRNGAAAPKTLRIAFPLPAIDGAQLSMSALSLPFKDRANFVGFTVRVDGVPVTPHLEERAYLGKSEVTGLLARHGLPLNPLRRRDVEAALKRLAPAVLRELETAGLIAEAKADSEALWRSEAKFHWEQTFPAGRELRVSHAYAPVKGNHLLAADEAATPAYRARYCLDDAGLAGVRRLIAASPMKEQGLTRAVEVPYIVTTARNWAGRIGRFTLTVDKGSPNALVSLCRQGVRKTGPTTFVWEAKDYVPDADLRILIVSNDDALLGIR